MLRKRLLILALAAGLPTMAMAMPENCPMEGKGKHGGMFHRQMNLDADQKRQMRELMSQQHTQQQQILQRYLDKLPAEERQALQKEQQASRDATHQSMRKLLKPEQQKQFDEMLKEREARRQN